MDLSTIEHRTRRPHLGFISHGAVVIGLLVLTVLRAGHVAMNRPFELDELLTVRYYTWLCATDTGGLREINHIDDYHNSPRPSVKNLLSGIYCSTGRWPEPNNHILNSVLVSTSLLWERSERAARLPALIGSAIFAFVLYWLCGPILGWRFAAPLLAVWVSFCPFLVDYGFRARGYTWMLALQVLFILAMMWSVRKPSSVTRGAVCGTLAIISFLNVVNMAVDWLLPAYLALFVFPPVAEGVATRSDRATWRRNLVIQMLGVGAVGVIFLLSHLPSVYSSSQQYGLTFDSFSGLFALVAGAFHYLLPGVAWSLFGALSVGGLFLLFRSTCPRWLPALFVFTVTISLVHVLLARRLPYERGLSYLLLFAMLGIAYAVEYAVRWSSRIGASVVVWTICAGLSGLLVTSSTSVNLSNERLQRSLELARQLVPASGTPTFMLADYGLDYLAAMYRPREWQYVTRPSPGTRLQIVVFLSHNEPSGFNLEEVYGGPRGVSLWATERWQYRRYPVNRFVSMLQILGDTRSFPDPNVPSGRALVFWYPDVARLGIRGEEQLRLAAASGLRYIVRFTRYAAKLDVFANVESVVFIAESPEEYRRATSSVSEAIGRLGGTALVFVPQ